MKKILFILAILGPALFAAETVPDLNLRTTSGSLFILSKFRGKSPVILSFIYHVCPPCEIEIPFLQKLKGKRPDVTFLLIASPKAESSDVNSFISRIARKSGPISLDVALDKFSDAENAFAVKQYPTTIIIDRSGIVVMRFEGYSEEKSAELEKVVQSL